MIIKGKDTIHKLFTEIPMNIEIPFGVMQALEDAKRDINGYYIAVLPYCVNCKVALGWDYDSSGFICPKCKRTWKWTNPLKETIGDIYKHPEISEKKK